MSINELEKKFKTEKTASKSFAIAMCVAIVALLIQFIIVQTNIFGAFIIGCVGMFGAICALQNTLTNHVYHTLQEKKLTEAIEAMYQIKIAIDEQDETGGEKQQ